MNLVKAQALANDMPPDMLKKYADGFDPRIIPPWVATGTLQAKVDLNKRMQNMMGGAQGDQPSVKEQIEQQAGLAAANNMQQMPPAGGPEGMPQPEAPMPMARGGLTSVPVQFAFKPGGIVGYSNGGDTMGSSGSEEQDLARQASELAIAERKKEKIIEELERKVEFLDRAGAPQADAVRAQLEKFKASGATSLPTQERAAQRPASVSEAQATAMAGPQAAVPPRRMERPAPRPTAPVAGPTQTQRPAQGEQPAQSGLIAAANRSPYFAQADADIAKPIAAPTTQGIIDEQRALSPEAMREEVMKQRYEERKARADQERAAYERTRPTGLQDLIRVFGQAGQYKGLSGIGPAYTANQQQKRADEIALEKRMNELYTAADTQEYEGAKELYGARSKSMDAANRSYQERLKAKTETLAQLANVDQRSIDAALGRLNEMQLQQMRMTQSRLDAARPGEGERFAAKYLGLIAEGKVKDAEAYKDAFLIGKKGEPKEDTMSKKIAERRVEIASSMLDDKTKAAQLAGLDALEKKASGGANAGKVMTRADVTATARASGKTEQQVIQAAQARGFTIQ